MHTRSPAPRLCLARNDTHFREGWPGEEFSPRPSAERCSVTLDENESQHPAPTGASHIPSLNLQKYALAELFIGKACRCRLLAVTIRFLTQVTNSTAFSGGPSPHCLCRERWLVLPAIFTCYLNLYSQIHRVLASWDAHCPLKSSGCWVSSNGKEVSSCSCLEITLSCCP